MTIIFGAYIWCVKVIVEVLSAEVTSVAVELGAIDLEGRAESLLL